MKLRLTVIALALATLASASHATGNHTPTPKPPKEPPSTPAPTPAPPAPTPVYVGGSPSASSGATAGSASTATATSGSVSGAQSGSNASSGASVGNTSAAGGQGGAGGSASSGPSSATSASGDSTSQSTSGSSGATLNSSQGDTRALGLSFAPGASTPPLPVNGTCAVTITQSSFNVGMGLVSAAKSSSDPRICHLIEQRNRFERMCLFASMKRVDDLLTKELLPGFETPAEMYAISNLDVGYVDMTPDKCAARRPPIIVVAPPAPPPAPLPPPAPPAPPPEPKKVSLQAESLFDLDKSILKPAGKKALDELAANLQGESANIVITGHTDTRGSDAHNDRLSMQRANAVRAHLALAGVDLARMVAIGKGKRELVCTERTESCHAENRRVEVHVTVAAASPRLASLASR